MSTRCLSPGRATGEDGFEIIAPSTATEAIIEVLDDLNQHNVVDAGLGTRDSHLEASMPLYGHELSETKDPISAGLRFAVTLEKDARASLAKKHCDRKPNKAYRLPWLVSTLTAPSREARRGGQASRRGRGQVTSGVVSPTLQQSIAMAMVDTHGATRAPHCKWRLTKRGGSHRRTDAVLQTVLRTSVKSTTELRRSSNQRTGCPDSMALRMRPKASDSN